MSVKSFKFVSPGIFVNEVDNSQLPALAGTMGPVIIGRAERGPAMVPVQINSFSEFVETFGEPIAGTDAQDAWRDGNRIGPTYGAFAAQAYLRNGSPITFVRLLGEEHPNKEDQGKAGWAASNAYGLYVGSGSANLLAGVVYTNSDSATGSATVSNGNITLKVPLDGSAVTGGAATQSISIENAGLFIASADGSQRSEFEFATSASTCAAIIFDANTASTTFDGQLLTIGISDLTLDDTEATATLLVGRIAREINKLGNAVKSTASANGKTLTLVMDEVGPVNMQLDPNVQNNVTPVGELFDLLSNTGLASNFTLGAATEGVAANPGADTEGQFLVNFDRTSKNYIRKILNTSPTAANSGIDGLEKYFLGATFDQFLEDELGGTDYYTKITHVEFVPLASDYKDHKKAAATAETPWILSQYMGDQASINARGSALAVADLNKLFKIHTLYSGAWEQKNFKISISGIKESTNEFNKYGTFSVLIRDADDSDGDMVVRERFTNVNLDPTSPRYIAAVIGDVRSIWQDEEKRYRQVGEFPNQSRYIRVEVSPEISSGAGNPEWLPYGFAAPAHAAIATKTVPTFSFRENTASEKSLGNKNQAFFGITTHRPESPGRFDPSYQDIVRPLFAGENMQDRDGVLFSLDLIKETADKSDFEFDPSSSDYENGSSLNASANDASEVLEKGCNKFTVPLVGGCDGLDITEVEPFCDHLTEGARKLGTTPKSNYAFYTLSKAIDIVADPEVVECNIITIPGVATPGITGKLITTCERRADALAIVDLEADYTPRGWNTEPEDGEEGRLPKVREAVNLLKQRAINSSYGCAFFPWVQVRDDINNRLVWMPPSVVALGTMASSEKKSELWFAPAGFTRGGLSQGSGGLGVTQVRLRLNASERDALYEANINPIAQFPAEGIVVFGQKTLQVTPSALDRINVRRLMIHVKKEISRMAATVLFDQNVEATWQRFTNKVNPFLGSIKTRFGLEDYKVILDETTTTPELVDRNIVYAKIFLKPARAIEYIAIDFVITNSGASFED